MKVVELSLILLIGDTHIPDRAERVDPKLIGLIEERLPWDIVLFTGDLTGLEVLSWVKELGRNVLCVRGNMDVAPLPKIAKVKALGYTIGLHHGDGVYPRGDSVGLTNIAKSIKVDILVSGHTHSPFIKTSPDKSTLLLNPGSLTGVWGGGGGSMKPSLMVLTMDKTLNIELYVLDKGNLVESKVEVERKNGVWLI